MSGEKEVPKFVLRTFGAIRAPSALVRGCTCAKKGRTMSEKEACCVSASGAAKRTCECRHKATERSAEFQAELQKRLNRAIGQLNGVKSMIEDNRYCGDVLTQLAAAESAVHTVSELLLRDHLETCVTERVREGDTEVIDEAMQLIKRFAR